LVADAVKEHGCNLYHLEHKGRRLQIYVDKKGGATIADCEEISRALSLGLAAARDEWRRLELDVSTAGVDRRLTYNEILSAQVQRTTEELFKRR
jgi:ribosome maturation factor RimP